VLPVTLDTSVYVGVLISRGFSARLRIDISDAILTETIRVLREKSEWDGYRLHDAMLKLAGLTNRVAPRQSLDVIKEAPRLRR